MTEYDSTNERHIAILKKAAKAVEDSRKGFIRHIMGLVDGRAYIHYLLGVCNALDKQTFFVNPYENAFWCGIRHVGVSLRDDILRLCPD